MRLLHSSDWHLGQSLHDYERRHEHQAFLDWLLVCLEQQQVDVLLVAGDIFDSANPAAASQRQLYEFLIQLKRRCPQLQPILIGGNHDSATRLEAALPLLTALDIQLVGQIRHINGEPDLASLVLPLRDRQGQVQAWALAVPYLRPSDLPSMASANPYVEGMRELYLRAYQYAEQQRQADQAIIALGHCHLSGGQSSVDSERPLVMGNAECLSSDIYASGLAYVALGHLHLAQHVKHPAGADGPQIRYSGSPLPLSFAETRYRHQVLLVDIDGAKVSSITPIEVPRSVDLLRLPEHPAPLAQVLQVLADLHLPERPYQEQPYLEVRVILEQPEPSLRSQIEAVLRHKPVRLARIDCRRPSAKHPNEQPVYSLHELQLQPQLLLEQLYQQEYQQPLPDDLSQAFQQLLQEQTSP